MSEINLALLNDFIVEAREHLDEIEALLLRLAEDPGNLDTLNDVFRPVHNIKGGSQITGLDKVARLSHRLEDLLDVLRQGKLICTDETVDLLIEARDGIVRLVDELEERQAELSEIDDLVGRLSDAVNKPAQPEAPAKPTPARGASDNGGSYSEEHDQELFGIFLDHLREQVATLRHALAQPHAEPDLDHHLAGCADVVDSLQSSANYMGYLELVALYREWREAIEEARRDLQSGEEAHLDFMDRFLNRLEGQFPDSDVNRASPRAAKDSPAMSAVVAGDSGDISADVMSLFDLADPGESSSVKDATAAAQADAGEGTPSTAIERDVAPAIEINMALLADFIVEASEHLDEIEAILLQLSDDPTNLQLLNDVFRPVHNIKGGSQITGLVKISRLSHRLEDLLDLLRQEKLKSSMGIVDLLIDARDRIVVLVNELGSSQQEVSAIDDLVMKISNRIDGSTGLAPEVELPPPPSAVTQARADSHADVQYEEEHDQELFGIFMHHLREQTSILRKSINELQREPDKVQHLRWCSDTIGRLWSAANYMGYQKLVDLYEEWRGRTDQACESWASGGRTDLDFMAGYLSRLDEFFPKLREVPTTTIKGEIEPAPAAQAAPAAPAAPAAQGLYDQLSDALDQVMVKSPSAQQQETLHQVYDEMVAGAQATAKAPAKGRGDGKPGSATLEGVVQTAVEQRRASDSMEKKIKKSMRVDAEKIDSLMNLVGELVVDRSYFFQLSNEMRNMQNYLKDVAGIDQKEVKMLRTFTYRLGEAIASLGRTSNELQEGVMKMRMLPISQIFNRYPRLVRDLTHMSDKKVELVIQGEDTELDKMIVEELSDPLIHIIRNAVDHGLENREERRKAGKPEAGTLTLNAYQESNNIVIEVTDDGRGISPDRIKKKALEKAMYTAEELDRMSPRDLTQLILVAGFSTAEKITGTSGRGVGMDVVKRNIEKLNGILEIDSKPGVRTQMRLKIPLTLAIIHALMIRVGRDLFTIPLANVDETVRIYRHETSRVEGVEVIHLRGRALPIFHLSKLFNIRADENTDKVFVVIVNTEGARTGFVVDELIGQEEVVIKPLADYVQEKSGFSGATIVGDGRISLILDAYELVKMTSGRQAKMHKDQAMKLRTRIRRGPRKATSTADSAATGDGAASNNRVH